MDSEGRREGERGGEGGRGPEGEEDNQSASGSINRYHSEAE